MSCGPSARLLIAGAAALSFTHRSVQRRAYSSPIVLPSIFAAVAVGVLAWDHFNRLHEVSIWLSVATLVAVIVRMGISFRENVGLMKALHGDALTDSLTKLGNRRKLTEDLEAALEPGPGTARDGHVFALYDLDGFKSYNDSYGHPAGDILLRRLGANLSAAVEPSGHAYRLGGDEFCILVQSQGRRIGTIVEAGRAALTEGGEGFRISASAGAILLSAEATAASEALRLADRRMYAEKSRRTGRLERQTHELLVSIVREREPELTDHQEDVSRLAVAVGRELGLDAEDMDVLRRAAEFHDIGKIAIPEEILRKPGAARRDRVGADAQAHAGGRADSRHLPVDWPRLPASSAPRTSAGTARAIRRAWRARRSRSGLGSSSSVTHSPRCATSVPTPPCATSAPPSPRSAAEPAPSSTPTWSRSSAPWSRARSATAIERPTGLRSAHP